MSESTNMVDLKKLSERELLILLYNKVEAIEETSAEQVTKQHDTDIALAVIKTEMKIWATIIGFASGIIGAVLMLFIAKMIG